jgi:hypothetical protein
MRQEAVLMQERFICLCSPRRYSSLQHGRHGGSGVRWLVTLHPSHEAERGIRSWPGLWKHKTWPQLTQFPQQRPTSERAATFQKSHASRGTSIQAHSDQGVQLLAPPLVSWPLHNASHTIPTSKALMVFNSSKGVQESKSLLRLRAIS